MKTALCSASAFGACTAVAFAGPLAPAAAANDSATAEAHASGPVALTEAEMDEVTAGVRTRLT